MTATDTRSARQTLTAAFRAAGCPSGTLAGEHWPSAVELLEVATPEVIAACWQAIAAGKYGDAWLQEHLSLRVLARQADWLERWQIEHPTDEPPPTGSDTRTAPPAYPGGPPRDYAVSDKHPGAQIWSGPDAAEEYQRRLRERGL